MDDFLDYIRNMTRLSEDSERAFVAERKPLSLPESHFLGRAGEVSRHFYYLHRGAARIFYYKTNKEITEYLTLDKSFFLSILSFSGSNPAG